MTSAVYVVSPKDDVKAFSVTSRAFEYDGCVVHVGGVVEDMRSVVFADNTLADSAPAAIKRAIANGESFKEALKTFRRRIEDLLAFLHFGSEDIRVFVHFGGQDKDEVRRFNKALGQALMDTDTLQYYAISFGNHFPDALFLNNVFTPPRGKVFIEMCDGLRSGGEEDFGNIRALRLLLSCATQNKKGEYDTSAVLWNLWDLSATKMSNGERYLLADNTQLAGLLHVNGNGFLSFERTMIGVEDFTRLLSVLERTEVKK